jgi:hypothetical protein
MKEIGQSKSTAQPAVGNKGISAIYYLWLTWSRNKFNAYRCISLEEGAMRFVRAAAISVLISVVSSTSALAHNVWCHCGKLSPEATLTFFYKAGEVYEAISDVMRVWQSANAPLETGVLAEFEHAIKNAPLKSYHFNETMLALQLLKAKMAVLDTKLKELKALANDGNTVPEFDEAITNILKEHKGLGRLSTQGVRYADVAGLPSTQQPIIGLSGIIDAQITDLQILSQILDQVISGLRDAIPLAERGEFARVMLSGRNAFGDKMPQFTDMIYAYERLYVQTCMSTISATMQIYPKGFQWLQNPAAK